MAPLSTHRLAAVWFADIVGFTALSARDERSAMQLVSLLQLCARRAVGHHDGRLVKFMGDAVMAEFGSTDAALRSALRLKADFESLAPDRAVPALLRIGVHVGEVISADGDIYGDGVNTASRIQREASPGEVLVSDDVRRQFQGRPEFVLEDRGARTLRGLEGTPLRLYAVRAAEEKASGVEHVSVPDSWAIAVLPFDDISPGHDNEYFSDGMTEELIHSLARVEGLRVASRTSSYALKSRAAGIDEIAETLGVNVVLEGSVRKAGNKIRVTPLLVDAANGYELWSETYERELDDVFALQETISSDIVEALQVKLGAPERIVREHTSNTAAYDEYLKGRYHWNRHSPDDLRKSIAHFEKAIASDPDYALAWAGLADTLLTMGGVFLAHPKDVYPRAKEAARKAIELDPRLAAAQAALAEVQLRYEWDWQAAEHGFRRALALDPNFADARSRYANLLRDMGRFDEAIVEVRRAQGMDPYSLPISAAVAGVFYHARRYDEAITECRRALEQAPQFYNANYYLGVSYLMKGLPEEALREFERVLELAAVPGAVAGVIVAHAAAGRREEAIGLLAELVAMASKGEASAYPVASAFVALEDRGNAFRWFDRAVEERTSWLTSLRVEPRFDHLHGDPRFRRLLVRVGLAPKIEPARHNLPAQQTPILGRERELDELHTLLLNPASRILTLVGPGGVGKTRLAMELVFRSLDSFPDGAWLVPLSAVNHPELLMAAIARALGSLDPGTDSREAVVSELRGMRALLLLDGFEHLLAAGPTMVDLLGDLPELHVVITTQATLRIRGERVYRVDPLTLPDRDVVGLSAAGLEEYGAVAMFLNRMESIKPAYRPVPADLKAIVDICRQLDGLPLAIELAAARLRLMSPPALLGRLEDRFAFLVEGPRDLPERQRTLRAVCEWSYGLLDPREQGTFRDLTTFVAGCSLEAAEWMEREREAKSGPLEGDDPRAVLDLLASLVEKSLLRQVETGEGEPRFDMLGTIRHYGVGLLDSHGEASAVRARQLDFFVDLALRAEPFLVGPDQAQWLDRLERDHENVAAIIDWALEVGEVEKAVRLGSAVWWFWWLRGHFGEMRKRLEIALERGSDLPRSLRANLLVASGAMATLDGEVELAARYYEQALALERGRNSASGVPRALRSFASGLANLGQYEQAVPLYEEALDLDREFGNRHGETAALRGLAKMSLKLGDLDRAQDLFERALAMAQAAGDSQNTAYALSGLGDVASERGRLEEARNLYQQGLECCRKIGSHPGVASALDNLGWTAVSAEGFEEAEALFREALQIARAMEDRVRIAAAISGLAAVDIAGGNVERGTRLLGASAQLAVSGPVGESRKDIRQVERWRAIAERTLGKDGMERILEEGRSMPREAALSLVLGRGESEASEHPAGAA